jgi:hypothetical protein
MDGQGTLDGAADKIDIAIAGYLDSIENNEIKLNAGDVLRLLDLKKHVVTEQLREVIVRWVESDPDLSAINI